MNRKISAMVVAAVLLAIHQGQAAVAAAPDTTDGGAQGDNEAQLRKQSKNNLIQLSQAIMLYTVKMDHRYPAQSISDKDGKPLLSWRVALLPFMGQQKLYEQFHLDEPWDSAHNQALIKQMPVFFRDPHDSADSTNASYFMPTGKGMFGGSEKGVALVDIKDGPRTIMLVEAKRDIPWTKPQDIEIDPDPTKPLPTFGGHSPGVFLIALSDSSTHVFSSKLNPEILHALFTVNGREIIDDRVFEESPDGETSNGVGVAPIPMQVSGR